MYKTNQSSCFYCPLKHMSIFNLMFSYLILNYFIINFPFCPKVTFDQTIETIDMYVVRKSIANNIILIVQTYYQLLGLPLPVELF